MKIVCIGGGPAGLYFSILMKKAEPSHDITIVERSRADDTFGWGVVFSDATLSNFAQADPETCYQISRSFRHWNEIEVHFGGSRIVSRGHGFSGIARQRLLNILQARAEALQVRQIFQHEVVDPAEFADADLIIAADGVGSVVRNKYAQVFKPNIEIGRNRYVWLATRKKLAAFNFIFKETQWGWFQAHAYRFDADTSAFIVETREKTWRAAGLDAMDAAGSLAFCERLFADHLEGEPLLNNTGHPRGSAWLNFNRLSCENWHHGKLVLMGDAAHTAHFSIGSGTKLAMEDAIALARNLSEEATVDRALARYQRERSVEALKLQSAARNRMEWFENIARYSRLDPIQFSYSLLTGSQRIGHENLRLRDASYVRSVETWLARQSGCDDQARPPMFLPFKLRGLQLANRVVVSPMSMYSAVEGAVGDFHLVHYGARAQGGAGLVFTEMTDVSAEARITPGCAGLYAPAHVAAWKRIVDFVHQHSQAKIALQLGHAGPKGSTQRGWEDINAPLADGNWPIIGPSPRGYSPRNQLPREMTRADMDAVKADFIRAASMAIECGFDMLELHCAHGYLLSAFITPLSNHRSDDYGGSLAKRLRYPLEIFTAVREVWPADRPMSVRISATDWVTDGLGPDDAIEVARAFNAAGCDLIDVSSGQTSPDARPVYGRMYQTPFADRIRNELGVATMAVGNIYEADQANSIIAAGRADLVALGRPHLADPYFTLRAAAQAHQADQWWPPQYRHAKTQLERNLARAHSDPGPA